MSVDQLRKTAFVFVVIAFCMLLVNSIYAEVVERIVAIVNDEVILLSEFEKVVKSAEKSESYVSEEEVLDEMINRMLLLTEAKRFWIGTSTGRHLSDSDEDTFLQGYIDRRIKAFIHIPYEEVEDYYMENSESFDGKEFYEVRDEIEDKLITDALSVKVREYIEGLRKKAYIRVQLNENENN